MKYPFKHLIPKGFTQDKILRGAIYRNKVVFDLINENRVYYSINNTFRSMTVEEYNICRIIIDEIL